MPVRPLRTVIQEPAVVGLPSLADLVTRPELVEHLPPQVCQDLAVQAAVLQARLLARIASAGAVPGNGGGDLIDVKAASRLLGLAPDTLYRKVRRDVAYRALTVDNGTDRVVFDPQRVKAFTKRRMR